MEAKMAAKLNITSEEDKKVAEMGFDAVFSGDGALQESKEDEEESGDEEGGDDDEEEGEE